MNIYTLLRLASTRLLPARAKLLGLAAMLTAGRRVAGIFIDPVLGCNLRCRMCYFSSEAKRREMHGVMTDAQLDAVERSLFPWALKLQIGCGAEPTLYPRLAELIARGRRAGVPYISITTNGQLIGSGRVDLMALADAGLDEITLSMHGTSAEVYEELMPGAKFELLTTLLNNVAEVKRRHPHFKVRVNYTVNSRNLDDLRRFWAPWPDGLRPDIVQLRPVQDLGESEWRDFDLAPLIEHYNDTIGAVAAECTRLGITCIAPSREDIAQVATAQDAVSAAIEDVCYCYVSPGACYKPDFDPAHDTFRSYHRQLHTARSLLTLMFRGGSSRHSYRTKKLNYRVK